MRIAAIGTEVDHEQFEPVAFSSTTSLLDFDAVLWDPTTLEAEYRDVYTQTGDGTSLPLLSVEASNRLLSDIRRRRREFSRFVERGRQIIVNTPPPVTLRAHIIEDIAEIDPLEALPLRLPRTAASGDAAFRGGHPFRRFAERIDYAAQAKASLTGFPGEPLFFSTANGSVAGGYVYVHPGHLLLIPFPTGGVRDSLFADALIDLVRRIESDGLTPDLPDWADSFTIAGEAEARTELRDLLAEQEEIGSRISEARERLTDITFMKTVVAGSGAALITALANLFQRMNTIVLPGLLSDDSLVVEDGERFLVVVAIGPENEASAATIMEDRLRLFGETFFSSAKGLVIHSRRTPPETEPANDLLARQLSQAGHAYMTGFDLLGLLDESLSDERKLGLVFETNGRLTLS